MIGRKGGALVFRCFDAQSATDLNRTGLSFVTAGLSKAFSGGRDT
jgi:hypothetical protein